MATLNPNQNPYINKTAYIITSAIVITTVALALSQIMPLSKQLTQKDTALAANEVVFIDTAGSLISQTNNATVNVRIKSPWTTSPVAMKNPQVAGEAIYVIYNDNLASGWTNGSYNSTVNFSNKTPVVSGTNSISFKANKPYAGLEFNASRRFSTVGFSKLTFSIYATEANQNFAVYAEDGRFKTLGRARQLSNYGGAPTQGKWKTYSIPLVDLNAKDKIIGDITIQDSSGKPQPVVYIDNVMLTSAAESSPSPRASVTPRPSSSNNPTTSPKASQSPTPQTPSPSPVQIYTQSAILSEDANFNTNTKTIVPFNANPLDTTYTFANKSAGVKTLYVKFTSSTGLVQTYSASIQLIATATNTPSPTQTSAPTTRPTPTATPRPSAVSTPSTTPMATPPGGNVGISGLRVEGNQIKNSANQSVRLVGVNFSGAEYTCIGNGGDWDVPANQATIDAMKTWKIKSVRITLNEDCWLGVNGISSTFAQSHRAAVTNFTNLLVQNNIVPIINLHFSGDGVHATKEQQPMANRIYSLAFWTSVANTFKNNSSVIFEPYNEPHLNDEPITGGTPWGCWRDGGCTVKGTNAGDGSFVVAGMQEMVNAIRATGAKNIIIITGQDWGADLSQWIQYKPADPLNQLVAGWHTYGDGLSCGNASCWNTTLANIVANYPIVATEIGQLPPQKGCAHDYIDQVMSWLDSHGGQGYLAWTWGPFNCSNDPALITNTSGAPTQTYGQGFKDHLIGLP